MSRTAVFDGGLAEMGRFLEAVGKALQKQQGMVPAIGELASEHDYLSDFHMDFLPRNYLQNEKKVLSLHTTGNVNILGTQIDLGDYGTLRIPHGVIRKMNVEMEILPEYDGKDFVWFRHTVKDGAKAKPLVPGRRIIVNLSPAPVS